MAHIRHELILHAIHVIQLHIQLSHFINFDI